MVVCLVATLGVTAANLRLTYVTDSNGAKQVILTSATDTCIAVQKGQILVDLFYETYAESVINGAIQVNVYVVG